MKRIVQQYVTETLERYEEDRATRTRITEIDREATYYGLSDAFDVANDPSTELSSATAASSANVVVRHHHSSHTLLASLLPSNSQRSSQPTSRNTNANPARTAKCEVASTSYGGHRR